MKNTLVLLLLAVACLSAADKKILVRGGSSFTSNDEAVALYRKAAGDRADIIVARSQEEFDRLIADVHGVLGGINKDQFAKAKNLEWVQSTSAGVEAYAFWPEFRESDVALTNCKVVQGPSVADHALALFLALARGLQMYITDMQTQSWKPRSQAPKTVRELQGMTAVVVGVGGIGTQIAQRLHGFGIEVIGVDPRDMPVSNFVPTIVKPDEIDSVLPKADAVFVAAPWTPESENMIGARQFDLMKDDAYFVVISRGGLYDREALVKILDSGKLLGVGLDVTRPEPLPKDHALWRFKNVIITPHMASLSEGANGRRLGVMVDNVGRFTHGKPLVNLVDKSVGY
jgi:phosphoglycerate dehydrogenase-like enzyme